MDVSTDKTNWVTKDERATSNNAYINGLNAGTTYYVRVRAYTREYQNGDYVYAYGAYSDVIEFVTNPNSKPAYLKKTDSTTSSVTVEWPSVPGANAYRVKWSGGGLEKETVVYSESAKVRYTIGSLPANNSYTITVYSARTNSAKTYLGCSTLYWNYVSETYKITPGKVTGVQVANYWSYISELNVNYNKLVADGYEAEAYTANKKKDTKVASVDGNSYVGVYLKSSKFKKHNFFKVRVRAYATTSDGVKKYGAWSDWKYVCQQPDVTKMTSKSNGMQIKYDKISGADRYIVYMSTKKDSGYKKVATTKKTSVTIKKLGKKKLKKGKTYYVYVVAYNKVGKKYYSGAAGDATGCWYKAY